MMAAAKWSEQLSTSKHDARVVLEGQTFEENSERNDCGSRSDSPNGITIPKDGTAGDTHND